MATKKLKPFDMAASRADCANYLRWNSINPETKAGKHAIHAYWCGVVATLTLIGAEVPPIVTVLLMTDRYKELV